jgi:hypothetical protein
VHLRFIGHRRWKHTPPAARPGGGDQARAMTERALRQREAAHAELRKRRQQIVAARGKA